MDKAQLDKTVGEGELSEFLSGTILIATQYSSIIDILGDDRHLSCKLAIYL